MSRFRLNWRGKKVTERIQMAGARGLYEAAEHLLEHANRTVPHDEGTLERSGSVWPDTPQQIVDAEFQVYVSYDTEYAARLHESEPGEYSFRGRGQRKWLERAAQERQNAIRRHIRDAIRDELRS